jgi:metal-responsive CopG/Arc/MetJ family transcriptional regulator
MSVEKAAKDDTKQMVHMRLDPALLKRLDEFRWRHRIESRTEAARQLLTLALASNLKPEK